MFRDIVMLAVQQSKCLRTCLEMSLKLFSHNSQSRQPATTTLHVVHHGTTSGRPSRPSCGAAPALPMTSDTAAAPKELESPSAAAVSFTGATPAGADLAAVRGATEGVSGTAPALDLWERDPGGGRRQPARPGAAPTRSRPDAAKRERAKRRVCAKFECSVGRPCTTGPPTYQR